MRLAYCLPIVLLLMLDTYELKTCSKIPLLCGFHVVASAWSIYMAGVLVLFEEH